MCHDNSTKSKKRQPVLAAILSFLAPGVGQVYCGRFLRGLVFAVITLTVIPLYFLGLTLVTPPTTLALLSVFIAYAITLLIPSFDALWIARRTRYDYATKEYNRLAVYILLWWVFTGSSLGYALHARSTHLEAFRIPAMSMYPTIVPNDRIIANKTAYKTTDPLPGDLVIFIPLAHRHQKWIKRVIALAGDTVEIKQGRVFVNDKPLAQHEQPNWSLASIATRFSGGPRKGQIIDGIIYQESIGDRSYTTLYSNASGNTPADFLKTTIPPHHCFVLGDNRDHSHDSRHYGPIPLATIIGRADYLYYPAKDWKRFGPLGP